MSINPFIDEKESIVGSDSELFYYKGAVLQKGDSPQEVDDRIYESLLKLYNDRDDHDIKRLIFSICLPKINDIGDIYLLENVKHYEDDSGIPIDECMRILNNISKKHKFGKYGPIFMVKYIEPIIDTRDNQIFAISFRDLAYDYEIMNSIPVAWTVPNDNTERIYIRDKMDDGFKNLYERLVVLSILIRGELEPIDKK